MMFDSTNSIDRNDPHKLAARNMVEPSQANLKSVSKPRLSALAGVRRISAEYFGLVFKNVIGWLFILGSLPVGLSFPGPLGIPLFLIGFALVTFPGKRKLTTRVMRGRSIVVEPVYFTFIVTLVSVIITAAALRFAQARYDRLLEKLPLPITPLHLLAAAGLAAAITWLVMRSVLSAINFLLRRLPMLRRRIRPWLRRKGINLLPPRRVRVALTSQTEDRPVDEIVEFDAKYSRGLRGAWAFLKTWFKRLFGVAITVVIFHKIFKPIIEHWNNPEVQSRIERLNVGNFFLSAAMFALFLFVFRAMVWRRILGKLGHKLPVAAATRIWSTSELARYVPGAIVQVIGRIYLIKPYGVRGSVTTVSQILELAVFLLANVLLAVSCLLYFGIKSLHGQARGWMIVAICLVPVLLLLLHPKITYGIVNRVMKRLGKPAIASPLTGRQMLEILSWNLIGLIWQSLAVYLLTQEVLGLKIAWLWVIVGAYCLAWTAGFLAFWAPGGVGVREVVFVAAMMLVLPKDVQHQVSDPVELTVVLNLLSLLLRLWATMGELMLAAVAYAFDYRGAIGRPDAPGRAPAWVHRAIDS